MSEKNVHAGHRARMRERLLRSGIDDFEPHEALELLLFYAVPMKNTSELAHRLIDHFGSFSAVIDAPIDTLREFGLTQNQATYLKMIAEMARYYQVDKYSNVKKIIDTRYFPDYIAAKFIGMVDEVLVLVLADRKGKEVFSGIISRGDLNCTTLPVRKIIDLAMRYNATWAILAHNHPSGLALPSQEDLQATNEIERALNLIKVGLLDHIIVADGECFSIKDSGLIE